jgi:hypothetical protein
MGQKKSKSIDDLRAFYYSVLEEWFNVENAASQSGNYTIEQLSWLSSHRRKVEEATKLYEIGLLESISSESKRLTKLTVALIFLTLVLAALALPPFIQFLRVIGWL